VKKTTVIGIAGTAKNTGKTTTLNCLLNVAAHRKIPIAVSGIGYDGEVIDTITQLPKPRIAVCRGMIVSTSEQCLENSSAHVDVLERTGIHTPLGEIVILRINRSGLIVVAGPNKKNDLHTVIQRLRQYHVEYIFIDGALNRIAPMSLVDSIVFTTGGSRSADMCLLCKEMKGIESLFQMSSEKKNHALLQQTIETRYLLDADDVETIFSKIDSAHATLFVTKTVSIKALELLPIVNDRTQRSLASLMLTDPCILLMNEDSIRMSRCLTVLTESGISVTFHHHPVLSCITANPFLPRYIGGSYMAEYLDKTELVYQLRSACSTPVFDTRETDPSILFSTCIATHP